MRNSPFPMNHSSLTSTNPANCKNKANLCWHQRFCFWVSRFYFFFHKLNIYDECKAWKYLLQPSRLLERSRCNLTVSPGGKSFWRRCVSEVVDQASPLANLSSSSKAHSSPQIRCVHLKCSSPSRPFFTTWLSRASKNIYALTVVDVASCFTEAEQLTAKESAEVASAFKIFKIEVLWDGHNCFRMTLTPHGSSHQTNGKTQG